MSQWCNGFVEHTTTPPPYTHTHTYLHTSSNRRICPYNPSQHAPKVLQCLCSQPSHWPSSRQMSCITVEEGHNEIISGLSADRNSAVVMAVFFYGLLQLQWCTHRCCRPVVIHSDSHGTKGQPCLSGHIPAHLIESVMKDKRKLQFKILLMSGSFS